MKALTTSEKFALIRDHGEMLSRVNRGVQATKRSDVLEAANRVIELIKSIPKAELGIEH
jgi:hypothetical protein